MRTAARLAALTAAWAFTHAPAVAAAGGWTLVREVPAPPGAEVVTFGEHEAYATGCTAPVFRTVDGGTSWSPRFLREGCHYGLEVIPGLTITTGGSSFPGEVDACPVCFTRWAEPGARFGGPRPGHVRHLSFLDARRGVLATDQELGFTPDAGRTVVWTAPPVDAAALAAVSLSEEGGHPVLRAVDENGKLWRSDDGGGAWVSAPTPLAGRVLPAARGPTAALRFVGAEGVLAASLDGPEAVGRVYRTRDGGRTWAEEPLSTPFRAAVLTLSSDARILAALDVAAGTVKVYRVE